SCARYVAVNSGHHAGRGHVQYAVAPERRYVQIVECDEVIGVSDPGCRRTRNGHITESHRQLGPEHVHADPETGDRHVGDDRRARPSPRHIETDRSRAFGPYDDVTDGARIVPEVVQTYGARVAAARVDREILDVVTERLVAFASSGVIPIGV